MSVTVTKEEIKAQIDHIPTEKLETLDRFIKGLTKQRATSKSSESFMEKMRKISFDGPPDFSENIDDYLYGDKSL
jgi:hypothetical protein